MRTRFTVIGMVAAALAVAACVPTKKAPPPPTLHAPLTFSCTGGAQTFTVPAGVTALGVDASGAQGGRNTGDPDSPPGGLGGRATAGIAVTPGETLQVNVGCRGGDGAGASLLASAGGGGAGGGASGGAGTDGTGGVTGGGGGTDSAPGAGGTGTGSAVDGVDESGGTGGAGGLIGGGGGGGRFGGGGGGGSDTVAFGGGGGGGSGVCPAPCGAFETGVHVGNGMVVIFF